MTYRYHEPLKKFVKDMKRKLHANVHKSHWKHDSDRDLLLRVKGEADELDDAIYELEENESDESTVLVNRDDYLQAIIDECADVANFAMMIADNARRRMKK